MSFTNERVALFLAVACGLPFTAGAQAVECAPLPPMPLTLRAAEERLPLCNRDVRAAGLAAIAAEADRRVAGQRPNPTFALGASNVNPHVGIGAGPLRDKTFDSSVRIEQLVERGGKAELREAQSDRLLDAARADVAEQLREQRLAMRTAFFDLAAAQERVRLQLEFRGLAGETAAASERRFAAGEVSRAEANRFRLDAARAENDARQAQADRERARLDLAKLIGAESAAPILEVAPIWPDGAIAFEGNAMAGSAAERPDVTAARRRVEAAQAGRELARRIATRDLTVGLQADRWPVSETNLQGTGISYGLTLSVPLHVRHANEGEAARASADYETARAVLARAQAQADAETRIAEADLRNARERRARLETEVRPIARDVAEAAEFAYKRGASGVLDLLDARRSVKAVELDEVQARAEAAKAWARREAALETLEEANR
jgi:cobalt-zinc-cadmium efflux system outer membrane protein